MTITSPPPGIPSAQRLAGWIGESLGGEPAELTGIRLIAGGRSNLTYRLTVSAAGGERLLVLRRPPLGHVLPTAHDMSREFRVLSAGIYARYLQHHQTVGEGFEHEGLAVPTLVARAHQVLDADD